MAKWKNSRVDLQLTRATIIANHRAEYVSFLTEDLLLFVENELSDQMLTYTV